MINSFNFNELLLPLKHILIKGDIMTHMSQAFPVQK